nr:beta-N-acetylhexosaminidase [Kofleriaceae bacterium]
MRDDVGQLLWVGFASPTPSPALLARLERGEVGATILFKRNLVFQSVGGEATAPGASTLEVCDLDAVVALNRQLHRAAPDGTPALIAVDHEGGGVQRVRAPATQWPPMIGHAGLAAPADSELAEQIGHAIGSELRALGFDIDFAPVLDVHTNPANPIIGDRAFGTEPDGVARRALAFARGLAAAGVLACGKHFPGHGDTSTDSHLELPRIDHPMSRLEKVELVPFHRAAQANLPMIMTAHVIFAALDPTRPATLSPQVVTDLLRGKLGYRGVVVSDDLDMRAIADHMGADVAAVAAIRAGCDALLCCRDESNQARAEEALIREAERDSAFRARVGEAAQRVRAMKTSHAAHVASLPLPRIEAVGSFENRRLADRLAGR